MITALNAHGHCPWVVSQGGHPKHIILGIDMRIDDKIELKNNIDYLKLALKISMLRLKGDEPPNELIHHAHEIGRLAGVSEQELNSL
jgi:hypothetical protein